MGCCGKGSTGCSLPSPRWQPRPPSRSWSWGRWCARRAVPRAVGARFAANAACMAVGGSGPRGAAGRRMARRARPVSRGLGQHRGAPRTEAPCEKPGASCSPRCAAHLARSPPGRCRWPAPTRRDGHPPWRGCSPTGCCKHCPTGRTRFRDGPRTWPASRSTHEAATRPISGDISGGQNGRVMILGLARRRPGCARGHGGPGALDPGHGNGGAPPGRPAV